ncbi:acyl-CoA dehydrogenase family protein [Aestuariivirga litoralis]|uniref:acyl-CoA dehydrogenase family protein n=1 Tax=Aestuariivirga litoralis TaxID=2650924 RepID=UPI0018C68DAF|nr:acyl-CoA dehydrogenase family protein [Aestuariivirga litoralis]MBG1233860.1 acyl-CoA dehydrogenase [Aestuariivirga litoralis]
MNVINVNEASKRKHVPLETGIPASLKLSDLTARVAEVAAIAAAHAGAVDRDARFPIEAITAAKKNRLLGVLVPTEFGGDGAEIHDVMDMCFALGRACSATAMIIAMHHVKVACITRHGRGTAWMENMMRAIADDQLLMGSSTTEGNNGGNVRSSAAAAEVADGKFSLLRDASVISYGAECDGIVTTARRAIDAASSDQVLVVLRKADYDLEITQGWEVMGMRGTRSTGFKLKAEGLAEQVLVESYDKIHKESMVPYAHLVWGSAWTGISASAVDKAQAFLRKVARSANGVMPPGAVHFGKAKATLNRARALLTSMGDYFHRIKDDKSALASLEFQAAISSLKIEVSDLAVETVLATLRANGLSGYRNDGEFSVSRELRDVLSSPLMIHNDRIAANMATANLMAAVPTSLRA